MTTLSEIPNMKIYTQERFLCPYCSKNNNFIYVVKRSADKFYLLEMCPLCKQHVEDVHEISYRIAQEYPTPQK